MADRLFDYNAIANIYKEMQAITGSKGEANTIAGILEQMDKDVHESVGVEDEVIFGDLGKQLLLDWENTSSNFGDFVNNFENWSALIAKSYGDYQKFEEKVTGLKTSNPLGMTAVDASGNPLTSNYIDSSYYSQYSTDSFNNLASQIGYQRGYNGIVYLDTNIVAAEKSRKNAAAWAFGLNTVATILSIWGGKKILGQEAAAGKTIFGLASKSTTSTTPALAESATRLALPEGTNAVVSQGGTTSSLGANVASEVGSAGSSTATAFAPDMVLNADGSVATYLGRGAGFKNFLLGAQNFGTSVANSGAGQAAGQAASNAAGFVSGHLPETGAIVASWTLPQLAGNGMDLEEMAFTASPYVQNTNYSE